MLSEQAVGLRLTTIGTLGGRRSIGKWLRTRLSEITARRSLWACALVAAYSLSVAAGSARAATYYVDSRTGSDANNGASASSAFSSLAKVNALNLQPGDRVLFARGATFNGGVEVRSSGTSGAPITFGAYGKGGDPTLTGGRNGIAGNGKSHIVVRDLHITNKTGAGIVSFGSTNWTIDNVDVDNIAKGFKEGNNEFGAFQFRQVNGLTIQNSSYKDVMADGVFIWDAQNVKILNNHFDVPQGWMADIVHSYLMRDYEIRGNVMNFAGTTTSGKGIMIVQGSKNGVIAENTFILGGNAGHYMIGGTIENGVIEKNHFIGRAEKTWSTALNISEDAFGKPSIVSNMIIRNNFFDGTGMGIYTWDGNKAGTAYRNNFQVTGNIFKNLRDPPLVAQSPVKLNGVYANNIYINTAAPKIGGTAGAWSMSNNVNTSTMPTWSGGAPCALTKDQKRRNDDIGSAMPARPARSGNAHNVTAPCPKM